MGLRGTVLADKARTARTENLLEVRSAHVAREVGYVQDA